MKLYIAGQVGPLERKNVENIALEAGVPPRTLQNHLAQNKWDEDAVSCKNRELIRRDHFDENAIGIIDETSDPKKGEKTVGVKRQHCGATGKTDNCVVSVHLAYATDDFSAIADSDLYLPQEWCDDAQRRAEAGVPEELGFRTKPEIALDLLRHTLDEGLPMKWLCADELYGRSSPFRNAVEAMGLRYVVEIPCNLTGWTPKRLKEGKAAKRVDELWQRGGPSWEMFHVKNTGNGPIVWEVRVIAFHLHEVDQPGTVKRLLIARNVLTGEVKYFLSNETDAPIETILHVAFRRWQVERLFEDVKGSIGFDQSEVRKYVALKRHLILSMTSLLFLMREMSRLRKKRILERGAGACVCRVAA
jgi:SRSO17 transposase